MRSVEGADSQLQWRPHCTGCGHSRWCRCRSPRLTFYHIHLSTSWTLWSWTHIINMTRWESPPYLSLQGASPHFLTMVSLPWAANTNWTKSSFSYFSFELNSIYATKLRGLFEEEDLIQWSFLIFPFSFFKSNSIFSVIFYHIPLFTIRYYGIESWWWCLEVDENRC